MTIVLDANAALQLASEYTASPLDTADAVLAPDLYVAEITNAVWKNHQFLGVSVLECESVLSEALAFPSSLIASRELAMDAFSLAAKYNHPAYDMFYFALAQRERAHLWTLDRKLRRIAHRIGIRTA